MVDKIIPYLINIGDVIPARSKATLLNEIAMALIECIGIYGKKINKMGKISKIATCFWPVRLIPLSDTRALVCSYLLNKQENLNMGAFSQFPPPPNNVIKGADPSTFLASLQSYNNAYLKKTKNFKRATVIQEALFSINEIGYFKNFFLNQYSLSSFSEPYFILEGDPIAKSVNQIKIVKDIYDIVALKDVNTLSDYGQQIIDLCDKWLQKSTQDVEKIKGTTVDTREEERQLARLNSELKAEIERDLQNEPDELLKSGNYQVSDKSGEFNTHISAIKSATERIKSAVNQKALALIDEGLNELELRYSDLGNSISRYDSEIAQLRKNVQREISDLEKTKQQKIRELERKKAEVEKQIEAAGGGPSMLMIPTVCAQKDIMSREMWEELDAPYQKRIVDAAKKKGAMFLTHNCGRGAYFDLLIKWLKPIGMNFAYLPYDCETEEEMIEKYSEKVIFIGYVDTSLLALGTPSEVIAECKREIEVFRNWKRGYILGSACEYPPYASLYNAIAMVKAVEIYGKYE